jgi:hypothetical protein
MVHKMYMYTSNRCSKSLEQNVYGYDAAAWGDEAKLQGNINKKT